MTASSQTQISATTALLQLLKDHPELPEAGWSIGTLADLHGFVHVESMAALVAYQNAIGGTVRAANAYRSQGREVRRHVLSTVWRDVPIEVVVALPVAAEAVAA